MLIHELKKNVPDYISLPDEPARAPSRRGFSVGLSVGNHTFMWINSNGLILVEHTGKGCELLAMEGILRSVVTRYADRATRLDLASDIHTQTMPVDFVKQSKPTNRITANGHQSSDSGETVYLGSRKSDRTVKVYRYFPPHPRADWLRIEYTYRKQQAKVIAGKVAQGHKLGDLSVSSGKRYGWKHICYKPQETPDFEIEAWRPERRQGKTVAWVYSQCIPAIKRLIAEGALDEQEIINAIRTTKNDQTDNRIPLDN